MYMGVAELPLGDLKKKLIPVKVAKTYTSSGEAPPLHKKHNLVSITGCSTDERVFELDVHAFTKLKVKK